MTPQREAKHIQRALRTTPVDAIAQSIAAEESEGNALWCIIAGEVKLVPAHGGECITQWDDPLEYPQYVRWLRATPNGFMTRTRRPSRLFEHKYPDALHTLPTVRHSLALEHRRPCRMV